MLSPADMLQKVAIGNDAGWALRFYREPGGTLDSKAFLTVTRDDYEAEIEATLPQDLAGGRYRFLIDGLIDDQYKQICTVDQKNPLTVRLSLYWRDTNASPAGYLANLAGVSGLVGGLDDSALDKAQVAELAVTKVTRQTGVKHYETVIEAQERVFRRLADRKLTTKLDGTQYFGAVEKLCKEVGVIAKPFGFGGDGSAPAPSGEAPGKEQVTADPGTSYRAVVAQVAESLEHVFGAYGRGMVLIQDGMLYLGKRDIPSEDRPKQELSFTNGLVKSEKLDPERHPNGVDGEEDDGGAPTRDQWKITLKGRPDLKPGDVVSFHPDPSDLTTTVPSVLGALAGSFLGPLVGGDESTEPAVTLYVTAVEHKLGRRSGFTTLVTGMKVADDASDAWETTPPQGSAAPPGGSGARGATTSAPTDAAQSIRGLVEQVGAKLRLPEVAEVRAVNPTGTGSTEPPAQTETIWRGTAPPDGNPSSARRRPIRRHEPALVEGVAYASPFAWGKCGLVLPRYPGTRVALVHRNGDQGDPIDVGALWESGHGPESEAGDWWLILPVDVTESERSAIADSEDAPSEHTGKVTGDLVDASGNRVISVGELTVTVGRNALKKAGERPERDTANDGGVTIQHADGKASIVIDKNGKITITADKDLELTSTSGDIKLKANKVDVSVQSEMNVH